MKCIFCFGRGYIYLDNCDCDGVNNDTAKCDICEGTGVKQPIRVRGENDTQPKNKSTTEQMEHH